MSQDLAEAGFHVLQNSFSENFGNSLNSICLPVLLNLNARMQPYSARSLPWIFSKYFSAAFKISIFKS